MLVPWGNADDTGLIALSNEDPNCSMILICILLILLLFTIITHDNNNNEDNNVGTPRRHIGGSPQHGTRSVACLSSFHTIIYEKKLLKISHNCLTDIGSYSNAYLFLFQPIFSIVFPFTSHKTQGNLYKSF